MRTLVFVANWKMNKLVRETSEYVEKLTALLADVAGSTDYEVVLAPPATHLAELSRCLGASRFKLGAQNSGVAKFGAYTGEVSPAVLKELHCEWTVLGHSERRHLFKEEDVLIFSRLRAALEEGLNVIFCVGEMLQDRKGGKTFKRVEGQLGLLKQIPIPALKKISIAYEPVWAIGTGENATPQQAQEVHAFIRNWVSQACSVDEATKLRILYGGSVKSENSAQIMAQKDVDGLLVGTASLDASVFASVVKNGLKSRMV